MSPGAVLKKNMKRQRNLDREIYILGGREKYVKSIAFTLKSMPKGMPKAMPKVMLFDPKWRHGPPRFDSYPEF